MNVAKKIKELIKGKKESFGTDPRDPWSVKSNINEDSALTQYLIARGINPTNLSKETKISHAKSAAFLAWKRQHQIESVEEDMSTASKEGDHARSKVSGSPTLKRAAELKQSTVFHKVKPVAATAAVPVANSSFSSFLILYFLFAIYNFLSSSRRSLYNTK